jgi:hypothetical protein
MKKNKSKIPLLNDDQISRASSFYENLPFEGLKNPPKQVKLFEVEGKNLFPDSG